MSVTGESTESKSAVPVEEAVNTIRWMQQLAGHQFVSTSPIVRMTLAGLKRKLTKPKLLKELVTTDVLTRLVESLGKAPSLSDIRLAASLLLAFLRSDNLSCSYAGAVHISSWYISLI